MYISLQTQILSPKGNSRISFPLGVNGKGNAVIQHTLPHPPHSGKVPRIAVLVLGMSLGCGSDPGVLLQSHKPNPIIRQIQERSSVSKMWRIKNRNSQMRQDERDKTSQVDPETERTFAEGPEETKRKPSFPSLDKYWLHRMRYTDLHCISKSKSQILSFPGKKKLAGQFAFLSLSRPYFKVSRDLVNPRVAAQTLKPASGAPATQNPSSAWQGPSSHFIQTPQNKTKKKSSYSLDPMQIDMSEFF